MISFDNFIKEDGTPIYLQIIVYIKRGLISGSIKEQDELPSRRMLSARLGVNPNTVQKAYKILEEEMIICSQTGAKSYITANENVRAKIRSELLENDAKNAINAMKQMGLSKEETIELINKLWD